MVGSGQAVSADAIDVITSVNDPGTWSPGRQRLIWALAFVAVSAGAWSFWLADKLSGLKSEREREAALTQSHREMIDRLKGLQALEARKSTLQEELARAEQPLPAAAEMDDLLRGVTAAGRTRGLRFELFRPAPVQLQDGYAEIPVAMRLVGGYHDLGAFLGDLAARPRIVTLHHLNVMSPSPLSPGDRVMAPGSRRLVLEATLRTYRALDDREALQVRRRSDRTTPESAAAAPAPAPVLPAFAPLAYKTDGVRDPFEPVELQPNGRDGMTSRDVEPRVLLPVLERQPLDLMVLAGVIDRRGERWALIQVDGVLQTVRVGQRLGAEGGTVHQISADSVMVGEPQRDASGHETRRMSILSLQEAKP